MNGLFGAFLAISLIHMGEEYFFPGGFPDFMKRLNPRFAALITTRFAVIINGLQLVVCIAAMIVGRNQVVFSLSVAGLLLTNGLIHIMGCIRARGYAPGVVTGVLLYLPLSVYAYAFFWNSGQITLMEGAASGMLGILYQVVPIGYLAISSMVRQESIQ